MRARLWMSLAAALLAMVVTATHEAKAAFPDRPITLIVPWAAGGGTDAVARYDRLAAGEGAAAARSTSSIARAATASSAMPPSPPRTPDGYTIGLITLEINMMHWVGLTDLTHEAYTPLALMNADPAAIHVHVNSQYKTLKRPPRRDQGQPRQAQGLGHRAGRSWHLALAGMLQSLGVDPNVRDLGAEHGRRHGVDRSRRGGRRLRVLLAAGGARAR